MHVLFYSVYASALHFRVANPKYSCELGWYKRGLV